MPIEYSEVRKGMVIVGEDKQLYAVVDRNLHTPGNWRAILTLKLKNLNTGAVTISRFKPEDKVEQAYLDNRGMTYSYQDGEDFVFTDAETFETVNLHKDWVGDQILYLKENDNCNVVFFDGKPISLTIVRPAGAKDTLPGFIFVHGGGWVQGARNAFQYWGPWLAARGYAVFAISYRLAKTGQKTFPHAVQDVLAGIQYVRGNAKELNVAPDRIGLFGHSAGGNLGAQEVVRATPDGYTLLLTSSAYSIMPAIQPAKPPMMMSENRPMPGVPKTPNGEFMNASCSTQFRRARTVAKKWGDGKACSSAVKSSVPRRQTPWARGC